MYGLTPADLDLQRRTRAFTDELIGFEREAEEHDGRLPDEVVKAHHERAIALGLYATNMPASVGGPGCSTLQQVLVQEQAGRVTNGIAWCLHTPPSWWPEVANDHQRDTWLLPTVRGEMQECYAITEEGAGSDVSDLTATAARDGDDYVLDGVKWHVTSFHEAEYVFFQAVLTTGVHAGDQALFVVDAKAPGVRVVRTPSYTHSLGHRHPVVAFEEGPGAGHAPRRQRGGRHVLRLRVVPVRAADGGGPLPRCRGATGGGGDGLRAGPGSSGRPLIERQLVQAMLADSLTELFAARAMTYETARSVDEGLDRKVLHARCSMAKLYASEMAGRVADRAVQIFGGRGYMRENVAERFFRELRVERIWEGASEVQRLIIADQLAKRGRAELV